MLVRAGGVSLFALCVVGVAVIATNPTVLVLQLADTETGERLAAYEVEDGETFEIQYVHSFEKTPIHETYEVSDGEIVQVREAYKYHAAGLEYTRETDREGEWIVSEPDREISEFTIRVARSTDQSLFVDGNERPLGSYAEPGAGVEISVERIGMVEYHAANVTTGGQT
jgi:hypothetical protein